MEINKETIQAAIQENESLRGEVVDLALNSEEGQQAIANHIEAATTDAIKEKTREIYTGIDDKLHGVLERRKASDQKTSDFVEEIAKENVQMKAQLSQTDSEKDKEINRLNAKVEELKTSGGKDSFYKNELEALQASSAKQIDTLTNELNEVRQSTLNDKKAALINSAVDAYEINPAWPEAAQKSFREVKRAEIIAAASFSEDGELVFKGADDKLLRDGRMQVMDVNAMVNEAFKEAAAPESQKGGGADKGDSSSVQTGTGENGTGSTLRIDMSGVNTQDEFTAKVHAVLRGEGISPGSVKGDKLYQEAFASHGVKDLPLK